MEVFRGRKYKSHLMSSCLIVVFAMICFSVPLSAETLGTVSSSSKKNEIVITTGEWPPYTSSKLKHYGVVAHLITDIFTEMGLKARFQLMPWARAYKEAATGRSDATGVWMYKEEREKDFIYSDPILEERFVLFHLKSDNFDWNRMEDLKGSELGGVRESSYGPKMDAAIKSGMLKMSRVTYFRQNFFRLLEGRIRLFPMEINVGYSTLRQFVPKEKHSLITHHPKSIHENFSHVLFSRASKDSKKLVVAFNKMLQRFRETGRYDQYFKDLKEGDYELGS